MVKLSEETDRAMQEVMLALVRDNMRNTLAEIIRRTMVDAFERGRREGIKQTKHKVRKTK